MPIIRSAYDSARVPLSDQTRKCYIRGNTPPSSTLRYARANTDVDRVSTRSRRTYQNSLSKRLYSRRARARFVFDQRTFDEQMVFIDSGVRLVVGKIKDQPVFGSETSSFGRATQTRFNVYTAVTGPRLRTMRFKSNSYLLESMSLYT